MLCRIINKYKYSDSALSALDLAVGHEVCPRGVLNSEDQFQYLNLSGGFLRYVWLINFARGKVWGIQDQGEDRLDEAFLEI